MYSAEPDQTVLRVLRSTCARPGTEEYSLILKLLPDCTPAPYGVRSNPRGGERINPRSKGPHNPTSHLLMFSGSPACFAQLTSSCSYPRATGHGPQVPSAQSDSSPPCFPMRYTHPFYPSTRDTSRVLPRRRSSDRWAYSRSRRQRVTDRRGRG